MSARVKIALSILIGVVLVAAGIMAPLTAAQSPPPRDPGVRGGAAGAGGPLTGLTANELAFFNASKDTFQEVDSVSGTEPAHDGLSAAIGVGLGPRFNMNSCSGCHAQPAIGGTSPTVNPQVAVATRFGATNTVPSFITANGPVREARFPRAPDGSPDGGVHDLFTIAGRTDAPGCTSAQISQPNFNAAAAANNLIFRIPTPVFGGGLIETIQDTSIIAQKNANTAQKRALGISGHENREGNTGTITRFGWKAQNKSLQIFAGEAYLVEQGVSNELFTQERGEPGERGGADRVEPVDPCLFNGAPEDTTNFSLTPPAAADTPSDVVKFSIFMRFLAAPQPAPLDDSASNGQDQFNQVGCALCHTPTFQTGKSGTPALAQKPVAPFSDLLVHHMGSGLADNVGQGNAGADEFRTAPLWGAGQRIFFLHDGRTTDLLAAINAHASPGSEANAVISNFNRLESGDKQDLLNFLRKL
jgi:CxxC motif-containing protein (DUF1111 family)